MWCQAEIIRFSFYTFSSLKDSCAGHLRYNMFLICQPTGLISELLCTYDLYQYYAQKPLSERPWTIVMPNSYNFEFKIEWAVAGTFISFIGGFFAIYTFLIA